MATSKQPILQGADFCYSERLGGTPTPMTYAVRAAGATGNGYQQPQRIGQFRGTQGALDHDLSQVERPRLSPRCHGPPSHSRGAGDRKRTSEGKPNWEQFWKTSPLPPEGFPSTGRPDSFLHTQGRSRPTVPTPKKPQGCAHLYPLPGERKLCRWQQSQ